MNPYLPLWEHIPDGEPHVFGDRVYLYGSHDRSHGTTFCMDDYICWSAPLSYLNDWRREGVVWRKTDDPDNCNPVGYLYAPDVAQGPDGRYYLYYFYSGSAQRTPSIGVAVCDTPAGQYQYYGKVHLPETMRYLAFDPAVFVNDDGRVWLYYGSAFQSPKDVIPVQGGAVVELAQDMKTVLTSPKLTAPNLTHAAGTSFAKHPFFEASSMRKIGGRYYFIYSSMQSHELCYGCGDAPDGPFTFGGVLISNGDIGMNGNKKALAQIGNNHGSLVQLGADWYVFYHRQTQRGYFARQGCAEKIRILPDGTIPQVEMTSTGLTDALPAAGGAINAAYCCNLFSNSSKQLPSIEECECEGEKIPYVGGLRTGNTLGFKYLDFAGKASVRLRWRYSFRYLTGYKAMTPAALQADGAFILRTALNGPEIGRVTIRGGAGDWENCVGTLDTDGRQALYLTYTGKGCIDLQEIEFASPTEGKMI